MYVNKTLAIFIDIFKKIREYIEVYKTIYIFFKGKKLRENIYSIQKLIAYNNRYISYLFTKFKTCQTLEVNTLLLHLYQILPHTSSGQEIKIII